MEENLKKEYYWLCPYNLGDGSVINPGNWGKLNLERPIGTLTHYLLLREYVFEEIRKNFYSDKVSRFQCIFLFDSKDEAYKFKQQQITRTTEILYKVELTNPQSNQHVSDYNFYGLNQNHTLNQMIEIAHFYWQGRNVQSPEVLTESPIRIIDQA